MSGKMPAYKVGANITVVLYLIVHCEITAVLYIFFYLFKHSACYLPCIVYGTVIPQ